MRDRKAVLVVSFGTSHEDTLRKNIEAIEKTIASKFPDRALKRAFTSGMIIGALQSRGGPTIDDTAQALLKLSAEGYTDVIIQPTHIMNGEEYEKMLAQAAPFSKTLRISIGKPLLTEVQDYKDMAQSIMRQIPAPAENEAVILMGHGTGHYANSAYCQLEYVFGDMGRERTFIGTVEGYPGIEEVIKKLKKNPGIKLLHLYPLMIVAGDHAKNDMAGEAPDSWKSILLRQGYGVVCHLNGLGENPGIREIFALHALRATKI